MSGLELEEILTCRTENCGVKSTDDANFFRKRNSCKVCYDEAIDPKDNRVILTRWAAEDAVKKKNSMIMNKVSEKCTCSRSTCPEFL